MGNDITMNTTFNLWVNNRANARSCFDIYIRITQDRKHKLIKTGISVLSRESFNPKAKQGNWIRGKADSTKKLNESLNNQLDLIKQERQILHSKVKNPSKENILKKYRGESSKDFIVYLKKIIQRFEAGGAYRTSKRYGQLLNKLTAFENDSIPFDQITVSFLKDFNSYLSHLHQNTRYEHFKNMKAAFNQAIQEDIISANDNPFNRFKVKQIPTNKQKLTYDEIRKVESLKLEKGSSLDHTRNCFLFAFYCGGIRAGDLMMMRWQNIQEGKLSYVMAKNRNSKLTRRNIPLIPQAKAILKLYKRDDSNASHFIFGELDNETSKLISEENKISSGHEKKIYNRIASRNTILNKNLKKIAAHKEVEISKPLTFHISRHSYAQFAINSGMTPKILQAILGHEKFATTETYISTLDDKNIEDAMLKLFQS